MKNELKKTIVSNAIILAIILLFSFISSEGHEDMTAYIGLGFLIIAAVNLFVGAIALLVGLIIRESRARNYGASMLLVAGISLLCGFTFCSMTFVKH